MHIWKFPASFVEKTVICFSVTIYLTSKINFSKNCKFFSFRWHYVNSVMDTYKCISLLVDRFLSFFKNNAPPFHHCLFWKSSHDAVTWLNANPRNKHSYEVMLLSLSLLSLEGQERSLKSCESLLSGMLWESSGLFQQLGACEVSVVLKLQRYSKRQYIFYQLTTGFLM